MTISQAAPFSNAVRAALLAGYHDGTNHIGIEAADIQSATLTDALRKDPRQTVRQVSGSFTLPAKFYGIHTRSVASVQALYAAGARTLRLRDSLTYWRECVAKIVSVTFDAATDIVAATAHGINPATQWVYFYGTPGSGITTRQLYYVVNATTDGLQVSTTAGGAPVNITTAGSGIFMAVVNMSRVAPDRSGYLDVLVDAAAALGMDVLYDCTGVPASVSVDGTNWHRTNASTHVTSWYKFLADRYSHAITHFEVWNEPNDSRYFHGTISGAGNDLTVYAGYWYDAIAFYSGTEKVVGPSWNSSTGVAPMTAWLGTGGGNAKIHINACHTYRGGNYALGYSNKYLDQYLAAHAAGASGKELWITEVGESALTPEILWRAHLYAAAAGVARMMWYSFDSGTGLGDMRITDYEGMADAYKALMTETAGQTIRYVNQCADRRIGVGLGAADNRTY